jgi:hypothetical protein
MGNCKIYTLKPNGLYKYVVSGSGAAAFIGGTSNPYTFTVHDNMEVNGDFQLDGDLTVDGGGTFGADVVAYYSSDKRFKNNIFTIEDPIYKINKINGIEFDWNEKGPEWTRKRYFGNASGSLHDVGVVAQEIQEVLPEAVRTRPDGYLAVDYEKIVPLLIEGIKDQQKQIESLEERIYKLESR